MCFSPEWIIACFILREGFAQEAFKVEHKSGPKVIVKAIYF